MRKIEREKIKSQKGLAALANEKEVKIKYEVNILPFVNEDNDLLIDAISNSDDLDIFNTDVVMDLIDYKWNKFAKRVHYIGWVIHMFYISVLIAYIKNVYLSGKELKTYDTDLEPVSRLLYVIGVCLIYPTIYDGTQMINDGMDYLDDKWNYVDMAHISIGFTNIYL